MVTINKFRRLGRAIILSFALAVAGAASAGSRDGPPFVPDGEIRVDRVNELMAEDADRIGEFSPLSPVSHLKGPLTGWQDERQALSWTVNVPEAGDFSVAALAEHTSGSAVTFQLSVDDQTVTAKFHPDPQGFEARSPFGDRLHLTAGRHTVILRISPAEAGAAFGIDVRAIEITEIALLADLDRKARSVRADARWMAKERFGLMTHWTKRTMPRSGPQKTYQQAVDSFDVERFADTIEATGATFLVLTTAHADQYFPAPLKSLDAILPGRTASRDLIADMIKALAKRRIKLFLYYHIGAIDDVAWGRATGLWTIDSRRLFANWRAIVSEVGTRYSKGVAGWWFDDGLYNYLYRSPDWAALDKAAKAGDPTRPICFNSWRGTSATGFQDYHCGEEIVPSGANDALNRDGSMNGLLVAGGDGRITKGAFAGLQAAGTFSLEGVWVHSKRDTPAVAPKYTAEQLAHTMSRLKHFGVAPIVNVLIYQDGTIADASLQVVKSANALLKQNP